MIGILYLLATLTILTTSSVDWGYTTTEGDDARKIELRKYDAMKCGRMN